MAFDRLGQLAQAGGFVDDLRAGGVACHGAVGCVHGDGDRQTQAHQVGAGQGRQAEPGEGSCRRITIIDRSQSEFAVTRARCAASGT